jgi:DNA-binding NarL/FixJ family response regulator
VHLGHTVFPAEITEKLARSESEPALTRREQEVLTLIVGGQSNKEIAETLQISLGTVKLHTSHLLAKLGVLDRTQATAAALQRGLVPLD